MRRSIPETIEPHGPTSCVNPWVYIYDANGHRRWCGDCGAELGPSAEDEEIVQSLIGSNEGDKAHDVPNWAVAAFVVGVATLLLLVIFVMASGRPRANPESPGGASVGVVPIPAPGEAPEPRPNTVPDAGLRPHFGDPS